MEAKLCLCQSLCETQTNTAWIKTSRHAYVLFSKQLILTTPDFEQVLGFFNY